MKKITSTNRSLSDQFLESLVLADRARDNRQFAQAAALYLEYLNEKPDDAAIHIQCGHMLKESGNLEQAATHYEAARLITPNDADLHLQIGHLCKLSGDYNGAVNAYSTAVHLDPESTDTAEHLKIMLREQDLCVMGDRARGNRDYGQAAGLYLAYLVKNPNDAAIQIQCGHMLKESGNLEQAAAHYEAARLLTPNDADLHIQIGHLRKLFGDNDGAAEAYRIAVELDPENVDAAEHLKLMRKGRSRNVIIPVPTSSSAPPSQDGILALIDDSYYLRDPTKVKLEGQSALEHYQAYGCREGLDPNPLFKTAWYIEKYANEIEYDDPLTDFVLAGCEKGRRPNALFDVDFYMNTYSDVKSRGINALVHYLYFGVKEGYWPNAYFDSNYYLANNPDVRAAGYNPLYHYLASGGTEGRNPSMLFDSAYYLAANPDVAVAGVNPLVHFIEIGIFEGRLAKPPKQPDAPKPAYYIPPKDLLPWFAPLNLAIDPSLTNTPYLNVLLPSLAMKHMSGGPNTVLNLAGRLAGAGVPVRFCSTNAAIDDDNTPFWEHVCRLSGLVKRPVDTQIVDMSDRSKTSYIGQNDIFLATAWWTAQMAKYAVKLTQIKTFLYMIQDYEPLLHPASSAYALAEETYMLDHIGIINTQLLFEFLVEKKIGRYADPEFSETTMVFDPAVDRSLFYPEKSNPKEKRRLLFYARPDNGLRNLFEIGIAALQKCLFDKILDPMEWEFLGMGEAFAPYELGYGCQLRAAPWQNLDGYAQQMRESDLLLSLMMSPHPSYPPLEMAFCGRPVVTNIFANKTAARLAEFSTNIIGVDPTVEGVCIGIEQALDYRGTARLPNLLSHGLPKEWDDAFALTVPQLKARLLELFGAPLRQRPKNCDLRPSPSPWAQSTGFDNWPKNAYEILKYRRQRERAGIYLGGRTERLSFLTTIWNTPAQYLLELADTVFTQDCNARFEWVILDNGSTRQDTIEAMQLIRAHPCVTFLRVEENLGIIGGMRHILPLARNQYVAPLDSDDLLTPDCVKILTHFIEENKFPKILYTDEDKILDQVYRDPYDKPDWDPVLFVHSCYIAHLGCFDRELAITIGVYQDDNVTGCHDYDTFTRFYLAGYIPFHIPEIVYTWRMHPLSTAGNISSKDYISSSQRNLLERFLGSRSHSIEVLPSPLFSNTPDWRLLLKAPSRRPMLTLRFGETAQYGAAPATAHGGRTFDLSADAVPLDVADAIAELQPGALVHFQWRGCVPDWPDWLREVESLIELFPDTVMVGGLVHSNETIILGPGHWGVGRGCESPDLGRNVRDPGYFARMWKPHSTATVPLEHAVVEVEFLRSSLQRIGEIPITLFEFGIWLGSLAKEQGKRVVYSPFLRARMTATHPIISDDSIWLAIRTCFPRFLQSTEFFPAGLSRKLTEPYRHIARSERENDLNRQSSDAISYDHRLRAEALTRRYRHQGAEPARKVTIGLMTSVYIKTDVSFLLELLNSIRAQTSRIDEWVILENGPISPGVDAILSAASKDLPLRRFRVEENLGIQGAMRFCLCRASVDFVAPMDADDLLEPDAIDCIRAALSTTEADLVFSDEDLIIDGKQQNPFRRAKFDPVLNAVDSYIWHLVVFNRLKAIELGVYSNPGAEHCHDWDTVTRFYRANLRLHHIPAVLYHWRMHAASTSGSGSVNDGSTRSVQWMLQSEVQRQQKPHQYEVATFPLNRGVPQLTILRRYEGRMPIASLRFWPSHARTHKPLAAGTVNAISQVIEVQEPDQQRNKASAWLLEALGRLGTEITELLLLAPYVHLPDQASTYEAIRLFEMHPEVDAVGGRLINLNGNVLEVAHSQFRDSDDLAINWVGLNENEPHRFALALKPQVVTGVPSSFFYIRRRRLVLLAEQNDLLSLRQIAEAVESAGKAEGFLCAYSPLIRAGLY